jgi:hypothetical protein
MMYDCYRKDEAHNPEVFSAAVAVILTDFTKEVIDYVTDPRTGLPGSSKWPPQPSEVKEACESRAYELHRQKVRAGWRNLQSVPVDPPPRLEPGQLTYEQVSKSGQRPIGRFERPEPKRVKGMTVDEAKEDFCRRFNISPEAFDQIRDAE